MGRGERNRKKRGRSFGKEKGSHLGANKKSDAWIGRQRGTHKYFYGVLQEREGMGGGGDNFCLVRHPVGHEFEREQK